MKAVEAGEVGRVVMVEETVTMAVEGAWVAAAAVMATTVRAEDLAVGQRTELTVGAEEQAVVEKARAAVGLAVAVVMVTATMVVAERALGAMVRVVGVG